MFCSFIFKRVLPCSRIYVFMKNESQEDFIDQNRLFEREVLIREFKKIQRQRFWGHLAILPLGFGIIAILKFILGYRIRNIRAVRKKYKEVVKQNKPLIICPNHLTMIDSVILQWAFSPIPGYFLNYRTYSWNVPAMESFKSNWLSSVVTYLAKCIPIDREGSKEHHEMILTKMKYLIRKREPFMIFVEGGRSYSGHIDLDNVRYGIGKIVEDVGDCNILCVYLRGDKQKTYSKIPTKNDTFTISMEVLRPDLTAPKGLRNQRAISIRIMEKLKEMEDRHFASFLR